MWQNLIIKLDQKKEDKGKRNTFDSITVLMKVEN